MKNIGPPNTNPANAKNKVRSPSEHGKFPKTGIHNFIGASKQNLTTGFFNKIQNINFQSVRPGHAQTLFGVRVSKELRNSRVLEGFGSEFRTKF